MEPADWLDGPVEPRCADRDHAALSGACHGLSERVAHLVIVVLQKNSVFIGSEPVTIAGLEDVDCGFFRGRFQLGW